MHRPVSLVLALALAASAGSCTPSAKSPRDALNAYAAAISEGRADDAYRLLADDARRNTSLEAFRAMVKKNRAEALELGKSLARPTDDPYVTAQIPLPSGEIVTMVLEDGVWKIDGAALEFYSHATPKLALMGFARAFARERWDILVEYAPDAQREVVTEARLKEAWGMIPGPEGKRVRPLEGEKVQIALEQVLQSLPTATFEETGDRAAMTYGGGGSAVVTFVREHGSWKVEDLTR